MWLDKKLDHQVTSCFVWCKMFLCVCVIVIVLIKRWLDWCAKQCCSRPFCCNLLISLQLSIAHKHKHTHSQDFTKMRLTREIGQCKLLHVFCHSKTKHLASHFTEKKLANVRAIRKSRSIISELQIIICFAAATNHNSMPIIANDDNDNSMRYELRDVSSWLDLPGRHEWRCYCCCLRDFEAD